jgi:photosystem II stability/assembly factor-like uncharacterized protein
MSSLLLVYFCALLSFFCCGCNEVATRNTTSASGSSETIMPVTQTIDFQSKIITVEKVWTCDSNRVPDHDDLDHLQFLDATHGWSVSDTGTLHRTVDQGKSWERIKIDLPANAHITGLVFVSPSTGWLVVSTDAPSVSEYKVNEGHILQTTDGGRTWNEQYKVGASGLSRVAFANQVEGWSVGVKFVGISPLQQANTVLYTSDQGRLWTDVSLGLNKIAADSSGRVQDWATDIIPESLHRATVLTIRGRIFNTADGGQSWRQLGALQNEPRQTCICRLIVSRNGKILVAGGTDSLEGIWTITARLTDNSWLRTKLGGFYLKDAVLVSEDEILACGSVAIGGSSNRRAGVVIYSKDNGYHWSIVFQEVQINTINAISMVDQDHGWAVGDRGFVFRLERFKQAKP